MTKAQKAYKILKKHLDIYELVELIYLVSSDVEVESQRVVMKESLMKEDGTIVKEIIEP